MKQRLLGLVILLAITGCVFAQTPDTLLINPGDLGILEDTIHGDTTALGERNNPNRVYQLVRGAIYFLNGPIQTNGWPLNLVGQEEDPANPSMPPMLARGIRDDGSSSGQFIKTQGDVTLKNLFIQYVTPTGNRPWNAMQLRSDSIRFVMDNCILENAHGLCFKQHGIGMTAIITNCFYRNCINSGQGWGGRGFEFSSNAVDTLIFVNNTYFNSSGFVFQGRTNLFNYARVEHNSIINTVKWPFQWSYQTNAIFNNNLFYNCHSYGETTLDLPGQDFDGQWFGVVNIDTLPDDVLLNFGGTEADRKVELKNNVWFYSQAIADYQQSIVDTLADSLDFGGMIFMNDRTQAMFDDDASYPMFEEGNTLNIDPGFATDAVATSADTMVAWMQSWRNGTAGWFWEYDPDGNEFGTLIWPFPEDLSYSTDSPAYTAATGGFPVGDLNWFPDKHAQWDMNTDVEDFAPAKAPASFTLKQNYPNPFNPATTINYTLQKSAKVELRVYNTMGREVNTLVKARQNAGSYKVQFAGNELASGVYICSLIVDGQQISNIRMLLLK